MKYHDHKTKLLPPVTKPKYIIFTDFDETYLAYENKECHKNAQKQLEEYLLNNSQEKQIVFGWVTSSSITSVFSKMRRYELRLLPHFIASRLGTELMYFDEKHYDISFTSR